MAYKRKADQNAAARRWYDRNKAQHKRAVRRNEKQKRGELRAYVRGYLSGHPCIDCGEADPVVLEFDHRDRREKKFNIADGIRFNVPLRTLIAEIAKCDVRCANCHRRKTTRERALKKKVEPELPPLPLFDDDLD